MSLMFSIKRLYVKTMSHRRLIEIGQSILCSFNTINGAMPFSIVIYSIFITAAIMRGAAFFIVIFISSLCFLSLSSVQWVGSREGRVEREEGRDREEGCVCERESLQFNFFTLHLNHLNHHLHLHL